MQASTSRTGQQPGERPVQQPRWFRRAVPMMATALLLTLTTGASRLDAAATATVTQKRHSRKRVGAAVPPTSHGVKARAVRGRTTVSRRHRISRILFSPWTEPTYADSTVGDSVDGEDLLVRKAAVDALGPYNGTVVVADPATGRLLSVVNQKLALKGAYQPCSTVKMVVSLASLSEGLVDASSSSLSLNRRYKMDMTTALARSNNLYFAKLGQQLGFERVEKYAKLYGLGEKAGLDIAGEEAGYLTPEAPDTGIGMMTSFGDGIRVTPLELTSLVSTIANGGTMYYLQYPKSQDELNKLVPRIKRTVDIASFLPQVRAGMMGAVEFGTARRASYNNSETILGKTGTCTDTAQPGVHLGWFGSFTEAGRRKLVVVVLLIGGRGISGPIASGIAGNVYRNLALQGYANPPLQPTVATGGGTVQTSMVSLPN